jgi:hypothetical protein
MLFTKATHCEKSLDADELAIRPLNFSYNRVKGVLMERAEFYAKIQVAPNDPVIAVRVIADAGIARLPRPEAEVQLSSLLNQVRPKSEFVLYGFRTLGEYVDVPPKESLHGHNTLVEISLPYTLHLPSGMLFEIKRPDGTKAAVSFGKVWTDLAGGSNEAEVVADEQVLYYGPTLPASPNIPQAPEFGPWPRFTGTNIEITGDTHGVFRYSQARVLFDSGPLSAGVQLTEEARTAALNQAEKIGVETVNCVLDVYRHVTGAQHVERLPVMNVTRVYFIDENFLSEGVSVQGGVGSAIVNRSGREIEQFRQMLAAGEEPPPDVLLFQSAHAALNRGQLVLAVVVVFQALEILLETLLRAAYTKQGVADAVITRKLKDRHKTKDRLEVLCREVANGKSVANDLAFWNSWLVACSRKRNGVVHRNESITSAEALRLVELCEECRQRLMALPFP